MGATIYSGSTPKFLIRIRDENGNQVDPSDPQSISDAFLLIYNYLTGAVVGRFYLNQEPAPNAGWLQMTIFQVAPGDKRIRFVMTEAQTEAAEGNNNMIQLTIHFVDPDCENSTRIDIKKGRFPEIKAVVA